MTNEELLALVHEYVGESQRDLPDGAERLRDTVREVAVAIARRVRETLATEVVRRTFAEEEALEAILDWARNRRAGEERLNSAAEALLDEHTRPDELDRLRAAWETVQAVFVPCELACDLGRDQVTGRACGACRGLGYVRFTQDERVALEALLAWCTDEAADPTPDGRAALMRRLVEAGLRLRAERTK